MSSEPSVRWGVLGAAWIAAKVARAIKRVDGAQLAAIASRSAERAEEWAREHGASRAYGAYQELIDDPEIDAVYIPLPPSMHAEWTIEAAERGKHVLCEKPLAANATEAIRMAEACRAANVQLMDGVMWVHHDRTAEMRRRIDEEALGALRRVTSAFTFNWHEIPEENIRLQPELAGGCLGDLGYYCVRAALWAFDDMPEQVYATARYYNDVEMNLSAMLRFANDRMASFDCGFDTGMRKWFEIAGTEGSLVCDDFTLPNSDEQVRYWVHDAQGASARYNVVGPPHEVRMIERFTKIVRSGRLEDRWPREAVETMRVVTALARSARERSVVAVE